MDNDKLTPYPRRGFALTHWLPIPIMITSCIVVYDYHINPTGWYNLALFFLPLTIILTILMLRRLPPDTSNASESVNWRPITRWQIVLSILGLLCFWMIAIVQGTSPTTLVFLFGIHHAHQLALFIIGIVLITWGMTGGLSISGSWRQFRIWAHESDAKWLLLIVLLGLFVRTVALDSAIHYYTDEANFTWAVTHLRVQPNIQIMNSTGPIANFTWFYSYFQYYYTELFGATLANLRGVSVIFGTLTIPLLYLLGRWAFNRRVGLLAAFLLAFYLPHIHFSRLAMYNIADPFFCTITIALLWRGLQNNSRQILALAGVFLGLTSYFYEGGRLLYPPLIIGWLVIYVLIHRRTIYRRGIVIFLLTTILMSSGFYLSLNISGFENAAPRLQNQRVEEGFWAQLLTSSDVQGQLLVYLDNRINPPYLHIMSQPDGSGFYYSRDVGLVLPHMLPFMLIGLGVALFHWRQLGLILPLWLLLTVLGNSVIIWNDWTPRFVVLFPALVLLMALGLDSFYRVFIEASLNKIRLQRLLQYSAIAFLMLMGLLQIGYYFGVMLPDYNLMIRTKMDDQDAGHRAQSLSPTTLVYILPTDDQFHVDVEIMQNYERHTVPVTVIEVSEFDFTTLDPKSSRPYAFFVVPSDTDTLETLQQIFGDRLTGPQWSPYNVPLSRQFALYQVEG